MMQRMLVIAFDILELIGIVSFVTTILVLLDNVK